MDDRMLVTSLKDKSITMSFVNYFSLMREKDDLYQKSYDLMHRFFYPGKKVKLITWKEIEALFQRPKKEILEFPQLTYKGVIIRNNSFKYFGGYDTIQGVVDLKCIRLSNSGNIHIELIQRDKRCINHQDK